MCKFRRLFLDSGAINSSSLHYIPFIEKCWKRFSKYFQDDFSSYFIKDSFIKCISNPFFWVVLDYEENFMGFVFLDNFVGSDGKLFSAEITTCFEKEAWGSFTRYSAKFFLKKCFDELGLYKIKAQIYPDNFRIRNYLKDCGFVFEATLKNETLRAGKPQDIDVYALYRNYYYKDSR